MKCVRCGRERPGTIADPSCPVGGYCVWAPPAPALDAEVFTFWNEDGILAGFALEPGAKPAPGVGGVELFASVEASAVLYKCRPGDVHPTPIYAPPVLRAEFLAVLGFAVGGAWETRATTRRELTRIAHAWAAKDVASHANARRN